MRKIKFTWQGETLLANHDGKETTFMAVARSLKRRLGADVEMRPTGAEAFVYEFRVSWFDAKERRYKEGRTVVL
jgi:hypothetical protein